MRSVYHVREFDVYRLGKIKKPIDIFISHDWPSGIALFGDTNDLIRKKQFLAKEIYDNSLGNPYGSELMRILQPKYWFAAHLHVKFAAVFKHDEEANKVTKFLALDKCLPKRHFLQVIDIKDNKMNEDDSFELKYDEEWLSILHATYDNSIIETNKWVSSFSGITIIGNI